METKDIAIEVVKHISTCDNEAETRFKLIDRIMCEVLLWPRSIIKEERYYESGRLDYQIEYPNGDPLLIVEAKSVEFDFALPVNGAHLSHHIKISALNTDSIVYKAMQQARGYANDCGAIFCCVTNGKQWYFFKTTLARKKWTEQRAFYISTPSYFIENYIDAIKLFSYDQMVKNNSLFDACGVDVQTNRPTIIPSENIQYVKQPVEQNELARFTKVICSDIFGEISEANSELMEHCYVSEDNIGRQFDSARKEINDSLAPFFLHYKIEDISNKSSTGKFEKNITEIVKARLGKTIVIFGGRGAGKTTFLRKILTHQAPQGIKHFSQRAIVTLTDATETKEDIQRYIYEELIVKLDKNQLLSTSRDELLNKLFKEEYEKAKRFELSGLKVGSSEYIEALNRVYSTLISNKRLTVINLVKYWAQQCKGVIIVIDNTDQFGSENQDFCFSIANEIAKESGCLSIITMREERFYNSKIRGYLDAYGISSYHLKSPFPNDVFKRRLDYFVDKLLPLASTKELYELSESKANELSVFLNIIRSEFSGRYSALSEFITSCSHGDVRLALDFFKDFLVSGYLNVREMLDAGRWNLNSHQVVKPMMVPQNYFYSERLSRVINIYRVRDSYNGSHFTGIRILKKLSNAIDAYHPIAIISEQFVGQLQMAKDFELNIDELLKRGMIESDNRLDYYTPDIQKVKITPFGVYVLSYLSRDFTYIDLIVVDTPIFDNSISSSISNASNSEIRLFWNGDRRGRMNVRVKKVKEFIQYLRTEELRESMLYGTSEYEIVKEIEESLLPQYERVTNGVKVAEERRKNG